MTINTNLVMCINTLHYILILFILIAPFIPILWIKEYILTLLLFMMFHYITNYGKCGLTQMEYLVMGEKYKEGFLYRTIKPVITVPEHYFDSFLYILHIFIIIILTIQLYIL